MLFSQNGLKGPADLEAPFFLLRCVEFELNEKILVPAFNNPFHSDCSILAIIKLTQDAFTPCVHIIFILVLLLALKLQELPQRR